MSIRQEWERIEKLILSPHASLSSMTAGREVWEEPCAVRTDFQRDRDRIIHSKAFRRLKHKTQVFISPEGDHYRTRLTHTLEVAQVARTISRALKLNEDLTEAIALGHDLGHTPFGHTGEKVLDEICSFGFRHREQSLRVVEKLENGRGLNLTHEVRDGILYHSGGKSAQTLEGQIVHFSDRIAYINHDIEDAQRAGILDEKSLPKSCVEILGSSKRERINTMINDIISNSYDKDYVKMSENVQDETHKLRNFLFDTVYVASKAKIEVYKTDNIIKALFRYFLSNPDEMSQEYRLMLETDGKERVVTDYIAGMTDRYAISTFSQLYIPSAWQVN